MWSQIINETSSSEEQEKDIPIGYSYDNLIHLFDCGNDNGNKSGLDDGWLSKQEFTKSQIKGNHCFICLELINKFDLK